MPFRTRSGRIVLVTFALCLQLLSSCVTTGTAPGGTGMKEAEKKGQITPAFQSKDYILYELEGGETPAKLAQQFLGDPGKYWVIEDNNEGVPYEKGQLIVIPVREEGKGGLTLEGYQKVPILAYHTFGKASKSRLSIPGHVFDQQMAYLKTNGYRVIRLSDLIDFLQLKKPLPKKAVVITIDDGYRSVYDIAYPILKKYGFTATLFIYTDFVGIPRSSLTWDHLREMKSVGFEVGSHTLSHCDLTKKRKGEGEKAYLRRVEKELVLSKKIIDKKLQQDTISLAFPYGAGNQKVWDLCEKAGYKLALSVKRGGNPFFSNPFNLRRSQLLSGDLNYLIKNLDTFHNVSLR